MSGEDVVRWARGQVGEHEQPWGSNRVTYWDQIRLSRLQGFAWCGAFAWDGLVHGQADLGWTTARRFVDTAVGLADARRAGLFRRGTPRAGDPVWFNLDSDTAPEHVALSAGVTPTGNATLWTIDGNVSDRVMIVSRPLSLVIGYARMEYCEEDEVFVTYNGPGESPHEGQWVPAGPGRRCISRAEFDALHAAGQRVVTRELPGSDPFWALPDVTGGRPLPIALPST